ncbi:DDE_3 domain-containing protein [Trichonephila clavipes]|nr:DDE_3 domain-containing protein [Trichonephila clavipes]
MVPVCQQRAVEVGGGYMMVWGVSSWCDMQPLIHLDTSVTEEISTPLTPTDLRTALQDSWCQSPPALLQTLVDSMPLRVATLPRARWGSYTVLGRCTSFFGSSVYNSLAPQVSHGAYRSK